jgi:hypothetical protein
MSKPNRRQQVPLESNNLEAALTFLERAYAGRLSELGKKIGVSRPTVSVLLKHRTTTERNATALIKLWRKEAGLETDEPDAKAATEPTEARPLGHIPFRGRDWSMDVPVYADESRNEAVMRAAARLLSVARVDAAARIVSQADADALVPAPQPMAAPSP